MGRKCTFCMKLINKIKCASLPYNYCTKQALPQNHPPHREDRAEQINKHHMISNKNQEKKKTRSFVSYPGNIFSHFRHFQISMHVGVTTPHGTEFTIGTPEFDGWLCM